MKRFQLIPDNGHALNLFQAMQAAYTAGACYPKIQRRNFGTFVDPAQEDQLKVIGFVADDTTAQRVLEYYGLSKGEIHTFNRNRCSACQE